MSKRLIDLDEADALNNGDDLMYVRQPSGLKRDRKIKLSTLLRGMFSHLSGVADVFPVDGLASKVFVWNRIGSVLTQGWLDLEAWFEDRFAPKQTAIDAALAAGLAAEASARGAGDTYLAGQITTEVAAEAAIRATALAKQQTTVVEFDDLRDYVSTASPSDAPNIIAQNRLVVHRDAAGNILYGDLEFHWQPTFVGSFTTGWTIARDTGETGAALALALRNLWGVGAAADFVFPVLHGTLITELRSYIVQIWQKGAGGAIRYTIIGWDRPAECLRWGSVHFRIPGRAIA